MPSARKVATKLCDNFTYPPRLMRADRAAAYLDIAVSTFHRLVADGLLPPAIHMRGLALWDRVDLDAAVDDWKGRPRDGRNSWDVIRQRVIKRKTQVEQL